MAELPECLAEGETPRVEKMDFIYAKGPKTRLKWTVLDEGFKALGRELFWREKDHRDPGTGRKP